MAELKGCAAHCSEPSATPHRGRIHRNWQFISALHFRVRHATELTRTLPRTTSSLDSGRLPAPTRFLRSTSKKKSSTSGTRQRHTPRFAVRLLTYRQRNSFSSPWKKTKGTCIAKVIGQDTLLEETLRAIQHRIPQTTWK